MFKKSKGQRSDPFILLLQDICVNSQWAILILYAEVHSLWAAVLFVTVYTEKEKNNSKCETQFQCNLKWNCSKLLLQHLSEVSV